MLFLDLNPLEKLKHLKMKNKTFYERFFMLYAWFLKMILPGCNLLLLLGMQPKFTTKISHNLKVSV